MTFIRKKTFIHKRRSFKEDASLAYLALFLSLRVYSLGIMSQFPLSLSLSFPLWLLETSERHKSWRNWKLMTLGKEENEEEIEEEEEEQGDNGSGIRKKVRFDDQCLMRAIG